MRTFTCLLCPHQPSFDTSPAAAFHAREHHARALDDGRLFEELFRVAGGPHDHAGPVQELPGPWFCTHCIPGARERFSNRDTMKFHHSSKHSIHSAKHGDDFITEDELCDRETARMQENADRLDAWERRLSSIVGVSDLLIDLDPPPLAGELVA